jgi:SH3 domain protein
MFAANARADYIGGELRVFLRAGPGNEFRILKVLTTGTPAQKLGVQEDWIHVRANDVEGWIPDGNLSSEEPPATALPRVKEKLTSAEAKLAELDQKLTAQTAELEQLAALKERNRVLEDDAARADQTARWKSIATGSVITLVGILIGLVAPRGGGTRSRLKL